MRLTTANVALPKGKSDALFFDDKLTGFCLRVRRGSGGRILRRWLVQYRTNNRTRRYRIGDAEKVSAGQAREAARKILAKAELGEDPQAAKVKERQAGTLHELIDQYIADREPGWRPNTAYATIRYLRGDCFKPLHNLKAANVDRAAVASCLLTVKRANGDATALRARSALSTCYVWGMRQGLVEANPVINTEKPKQADPRERVLIEVQEHDDGGDTIQPPDGRELAAVWNACEDLGEYGKIVRLLALTGCRRVEIGGMRWSEFDRERGLWTLPQSRSKNGRELVLPLPPLAWSIIDSVPVVVDRDNLFGERASRGFCTWGTGKTALDERLGDSVAPFVLHDVRRTVSTGLEELGVEPSVVDAVLNHRTRFRSGVRKHYSHATLRPQMRRALALWADFIAAITSGAKRKVLAFEQRAEA